MNLEDCYIEEDLFPKIFTDYEEREYGILFFNTDNKDSYDSNHAVIYKDKIRDLQHVLSDITGFYKEKGSRPIIYQSMLDDNWFEEIKEELSAAGFYRSRRTMGDQGCEENTGLPGIMDVCSKYEW